MTALKRIFGGVRKVTRTVVLRKPSRYADGFSRPRKHTTPNPIALLLRPKCDTGVIWRCLSCVDARAKFSGFKVQT